MPEAFALRWVSWQLFATLTFRSPTRHARHRTVLFTWVRDVAHSCHVHFRRVLWLARYELGRTIGNGHYHLCIAGLPIESVGPAHCRTYEASWWRRGGLAQIESYDRARDGLGYVLKRPNLPSRHVCDGDFRDHQDNDFIPTLSDSLIETMRRRPM